MRWNKLDDRLSKIKKKLAKRDPVNLAKTIENTFTDCIQRMVVQETDRVVENLEKMSEGEQEMRSEGGIR